MKIERQERSRKIYRYEAFGKGLEVEKEAHFNTSMGLMKHDRIAKMGTISPKFDVQVLG